MSRPLIGVEGAVTSWGSANLYATILANTRPNSATLNVMEEDEDVTGLSSTAQASLGKLKSSTTTFRAYGSTAPRIGNVGIVTVVSGSQYATHVYNWSLTIESKAVHDITALNVGDTLSAGIPYWKRFMPDYSTWSGSMEVGLDSATALTMPINSGGTLPVIDFFYAASSAAKLRGTVLVTGVTPAVTVGQPTRATYSFRGNGELVSSGASDIFGGYTFGIPLWSQGSGTVGAHVITTATSRTLSVYDSFWKRITLSCRVGEPITIEIETQNSGEITVG